MPDTFKCFEARYESIFVRPTKVLSWMRLSERIPFKNCAVIMLKHATRISTEKTSIRKDMV